MFSIAKYFTALIILLWATSTPASAQRTKIKGFVEVNAAVQDGKVDFGIGEQDLFITSEINNRISFLGETVFKFSPSSPTDFNVSVERIIVKYNYHGNHNLLIGKHHTPLNYWNDTYHHGRVFYPTIQRPLLFSEDIVPLHTTGISLQGLNLGKLRFGYELMIGNGIGSNDSLDDNRNKSITAAIHIRPKNELKIGLTYYTDVISEGANVHGHRVDARINQHLMTGYLAYFGKKYEFLAESVWGVNHNAANGDPLTVATYAYGGIKLKKWVPYVRVDHLTYDNNEIFFEGDDTTSLILGVRYEINFLAVVKLEYQHIDRDSQSSDDRVTAQFAIGF